MRTKEQKLWDAFKSHKPPSVDLHRVENVAETGTPDVHAIAAGGVMNWIELKRVIDYPGIKYPVLGSGGLNRAQEGWHRLASHKEAKCYTLVGVDIPGGMDLYFVPACFALHLNDARRPALEQMSVADSWIGIYAEIMRKC